MNHSFLVQMIKPTLSGNKTIFNEIVTDDDMETCFVVTIEDTFKIALKY